MTDLLLPEPPIPGITFRTYRGDEDIPPIADLLTASFAANGDPMAVDPEELRVESRHWTNVDVSQDMILGFAGDISSGQMERAWYGTDDFQDFGQGGSLGAIAPTYSCDPSQSASDVGESVLDINCIGIPAFAAEVEEREQS